MRPILTRSDMLRGTVNAGFAFAFPFSTLAASRPETSLAAIATTRGISFGSAVSDQWLGNKKFTRLVARECDTITAENSLKWKYLEAEQNIRDSLPAKALAKFARRSGLNMRGHCFVWNHDERMPAWLVEMTDELRRGRRRPLTKRMWRHAAYLGRTFPEITSWDVVNEALDPSNGEIRDSAIPLARTGIALHDFAADDAIRNAREALDRYRGRGGEYVNLSENRETGSLVSQAFRFLDLEGWGRYYADRVFDSFTPSSYFDQAINQTPGPFLIRNTDGSYNAQQAENFDALSSFLQGVALDPLSVASSKRRLRFGNGNFVEPNFGVSTLNENLRNQQAISGGLDTIFDAPLPTAIWLRGNYTDISDNRGRPDISPFSRRRGGDSWFLSSYVGLELTPSDSFVINGELNHDSSLSETDVLGLQNNSYALEEDREIDRNFLFGLYNHEFGYRDQLTIGAGFGKSQLNVISLDTTSTLPFADQFSQSRGTFTYLSSNYAKGFGPLDLRIGAEWSDVRTSEINADYDFARDIIAPGAPPIIEESRTSEARAYLDLRYHPIESLVV